MSLDTLAARCVHAVEIKHSRFIAHAAPVASPQAALDFVAAVSDPAATHNCWAYRVGAQYRFSDDGEPAGTAGRPILAAIDGQGYDRVAVVVVALQRSGGNDPVAVVTVLLSVLSVTLAWGVVNTVFALKYARMYYFDEPDLQGFDFGMDADPAYSDFAYLAFTIGMAFTPSEARADRTDTRRVVLGHALLSCLFGTGLMAVAISLVTNLGS